jgi:hypothetical protein
MLSTPTKPLREGTPMTASPRRPRLEARTPTRVVDRSGQVWVHPDPLHLHRWIARRNELLRVVAVAAGHPGQAD